MNTYPALTISLLDRLTNRELQSHYLNHLDRTAEVASLLKQITDPDLALRIVNLALEIDLNLGASLTSSLAPELQKIVVDEIDRLEIPTRLKIDLWSRTKSKAALPYLQDIFIFKHRQPNDWHGYRAIESAIAIIIEIDRDLAISLLIEGLYDARFYSKAVEFLTELAPVEAIDGLAGLLSSPDLHNYGIRYHTIEALIKIGTEEAIAKIRDALHVYKLQWSYTDWTQALGIVAEPAMVEHLIYLLYEPAAYTERLASDYEAYEVDRLCREAITALERIGGEKVFDWLHQAMYWISAADEFHSPFSKIVETLFRLDTERMLIALEGAIQSCDPKVRKRAARSLFVWDIIPSDRNLSILLDSIDDPDLDVQLEIINSIRQIVCNYDLPNISSELSDRAIYATKQILLRHIKHPSLEIRNRVILRLVSTEPDEREIIIKSLSDVSSESLYRLKYRFANEIVEPADLPILLKYLNHASSVVKACVAASIGRSGDNSIVPILLELLHDLELEIRESAVTSIVELGSVEIFPILLELANNPELVATLICKLKECQELGTSREIFDEFYRDREVTTKFIETAENSLIESISNNIGHLCQNIYMLGEIGSDLSIPTLQKIIRSHNYSSYDEPEDALRSLAKIGSCAAKIALLEVLIDRPELNDSIFRIFSADGKLGIVPRLWSTHRQTYVEGALDAISIIQEKEGLYNPDFSDRSHLLFEPPRRRLRDVLLGNTAIEI